MEHTAQDQLVHHFQKKGFKVTLAAREVFQVLWESEPFLSAYEIQKRCPHKHSISTIYRVLERLQASLLVHEFHGKWHKCTNPENLSESHHFLICERCGGVEEIFLDYYHSLSAQLAREKDFILKKVHLGFLGICRQCHSRK